MSFRIGISPDFYEDAKGHFEGPIEEKLAGLPGIECGPMPPQPGKLATADALQQFDAIFPLALKITTDSLIGVERLAVVARWGVGYDRIDVEALTAADVALCITPSAVRRPVAEAILTFVFALAKNLKEQDRVVRGGGWRGDLSRLGLDIPNMVLGSVGCGNIGQELFRLARPLGFKRLIAYDPYINQEQVSSLGIEMTDLNSVFRESDFVAVNTLLNRETEGLVQESHFRLMKPTAFFINTARGPIVRHEALVRALREDWIAGAGIDVFPVEPPPKDDPLFTLDNVLVAPHALAWTEGIMRNNGLEAIENVLAVARGEVPAGVVNREVLSRPAFRKKLARYGGGVAFGAA
jgi:phosphoglycerate dehydrogenase-like enzyme